MSNDDRFFCVLFLTIGLAIGTVSTGFLSDRFWEREAIEAGVGRYNATTGNFEFIPLKKAD